VAAEVLRRRNPAGDPSALRQTILDVARSETLTKDMIQQKSDPALTQLEAMFVVKPADVFSADAALAADRAENLALADLAEKAAGLLSEKDRSKLPPCPTRADLATQLDAADDLATLLAAPLSPSDRQTLVANAAISQEIDPEEARGFQRLNQIRILIGLPAQVIDLKLVAACRVHSEDMVTKGFFAHESPVPGRETPWKRAQVAGTSANAENIAAGTLLGADAIQMWWYSPGHHKNMLGTQKRVGLGRYEGHWTQMFG
jgi:uncharacterized protein YkwD